MRKFVVLFVLMVSVLSFAANDRILDGQILRNNLQVWTLPTTDGTNGQMLSTNGAGILGWSTASGGGGGANPQLSNLSSVAINASLLPGVDSGIDIGSTSKRINSVYIYDGLKDSSGVKIFDMSQLGLRRSSGVMSVWIGNNTLQNAANISVLDWGGNLRLGQALLAFPNVDGTSGQVLTTDGSGNLSWASGGGGGFSNPATSDLDMGGFAINNVAQVTSPTSIKITPTALSTNSGSRYNVNIETPSDDILGHYGGHINITAGYGGSDIGNVNVTGASVNFTEGFWGYQLAKIYPGGNSSHQGILALYDGSGTGKRLNILSADNLASDVTLTFPSTDGDSGQVLSTDGSGNLSWVSGGGGGGATTALDNLAAVAINVPLDFAANGGVRSPQYVEIISQDTNGSALGVYNGTIDLYTGVNGDAQANIYAATTELLNDGGGVAPQLRFWDAGQANQVGVKALNTLSGSYVLTLPPDAGTSGQVLTTDGAGTLTWTSSGGATIALDNLASTAVNADILPDVTATRKLGSLAKQFNEINGRYISSTASASPPYDYIQIYSDGGNHLDAYKDLLITAYTNTGDPGSNIIIDAGGDTTKGKVVLISTDVSVQPGGANDGVLIFGDVGGDPSQISSHVLTQDATGSNHSQHLEIKSGNADSGNAGNVYISAGSSNTGTPGYISLGSSTHANLGVQLSTSGSQPTCDAAHRGLMWNVEGGAGVADILQVCQKNASDVYVWTTH